MMRHTTRVRWAIFFCWAALLPIATTRTLSAQGTAVAEPPSAEAPSSEAAAKKDRIIINGTTIDPEEQIKASQALAKSIADPGAESWRAKGDQNRKYRFEEAGADIGYRIVVPDNWDGESKLPMVVMLHGAGGDENMYLNSNGGQLPKLAQEHGYLLVSPIGYTRMGAYGTILRLPAVFGEQEAAAEKLTQLNGQRERELELSEKDVINVIEIVRNEYPVDDEAVFLTGHSMGSGGTWYLGTKYNMLFDAIAPMSGPFVDKQNHPWDRIREMPIFMTEGIQARPSLVGSRAMNEWMQAEGFNLKYKEVDGDHGRMVPMVLPDVFDFFDEVRAGKSEG